MSSYHEKHTMICNKCKKEKTLDQFYYHRQRKHYMKTCKECNSKICKDYQNKKRKDLNFVTQRRAAEIRRRSKIKNIPVDNNLTNIIRELWEKQNGKCYYTGLEMKFDGNYETDDLFMTVDRIIPNLGYVEENVCLCCSVINRMKQNLNIEDLKNYCKLLIDNN